MSALNEMIARQPDALRAVAELDLAPALEVLRGRDRLVFVGTGTSFHAAELAAWAINTGAGDRRARPVESSRLVGLAADEAVILITHTGETAYSQRVRERLLTAGQPLVSITGPAAGWPEAIVTPVKETAETYTVSYTAALAVLGRLAHALIADESDATVLSAVVERVEHVLADPAIDHVAVPARALALVGAGPWAVTAREAALKLREGARILCEGFDAERLLHGFAVPYGPADGLVLVEPAGDGDGLVAALGAAARSEGIPVSELADAEHPPLPLAGADVVFGQIPMTVRVQCLAARFAQLRGTDPDTAITGAWAQPELWTIGGPESS